MVFASFFFFNDTATTEIYTLSLHDALPIYLGLRRITQSPFGMVLQSIRENEARTRAIGYHVERYKDRKSTRLNSSHGYISHAVFCLKKKNSIAPLSRPCCCSRSSPP